MKHAKFQTNAINYAMF